MNPYEDWLGISVGKGSPDFFQLLGIARDESDPETIKAAAVLQTRKLMKYREGAHAETCEKLIARVKKSYQVLSKPELRDRYLVGLRESEEKAGAKRGTVSGTPKSTAAAGRSSDARDPATGEEPLRAVASGGRSKAMLAIASLSMGLVVIAGAVAFYLFGQTPKPLTASSPVTSPGAAMTTQPAVSLPTTSPEPKSATASSGVSLPGTPDRISDNAPLLSSNRAEDPEHTASSEAGVPAPGMLAERSVGGGVGPVEASSANVSVAASDANESVRQPIEVVSGEMQTANAEDDARFSAASILKKHCFRCHGENETDEGGFGFALNRAKLVSSGFVRPRDPGESLLHQRMISTDTPMPPEGEQPRPTAQEIGLIHDWIRSGASPFDDVESSPFLSTEKIDGFIATDLKRISERDRPFIRYFSVVHLANAGYSKEELDVYKKALAKLANSLSWNRKLAKLSPIENLDTVFRMDLRDLKWTPDLWQTISTSYPYAVVTRSPDAAYIRSETKCEVPVVRGDWFVASASRPPLYHDLAQIPQTDRLLERLLRVDVQKNIDQERVMRIGFARSGVSQHNRLVERHESIFGAYWKSYDFSGSTERKNLFDNPLGPGTEVGTFSHDGGEIIFQLPNGMLAYMLTDQAGNRIDKGPTAIVSDPRQPDRAVVNGVSCMSCHYGGFIQKNDEIRKHVVANQSAYPRHQDIMALYASPDASQQVIASDTRLYLTALGSDEIGMLHPTRAGEPIVLVSNRYRNELDAALAAAEVGLPTEEFVERLGKIANADLSRKVGALKTAGGVVKRQAFDQVFEKLVRAMNLGQIALVRAPVAAGRGQVADANLADDRLSNLPLGNNPAAAQAALAQAIRAFESRDPKTSVPLFDNSIRLAASTSFRVRCCEQAIPMYEKLDAVERLIDAHKNILDACQNGVEINRARTNLFASLVRFTQKSSSWNRRPSRSSSSQRVDWSAQFPSSVSNAIAAVFESQLETTPDHEASLRVLQTYYQRIHDRPEKRRVILTKLKAIYQGRNEPFDAESDLDLASLLAASGPNSQAAAIYGHHADQATGLQAATLRLMEAVNLKDPSDKPKALIALKRAQKGILLDRSPLASAQLAKIGDAYADLAEAELAADSYKRALRLEKNPSQVHAIQAKLTKTLTGLGKVASVDPKEESMDELMDPLRRFRIEAEAIESRSTYDANGVFVTMLAAADAWIKAEDADRAKKSLDKAGTATKRMTYSGKDRYHAQLADLYLKIDQRKDALHHFVQSLKLASNEPQIVKYQVEIENLIQTDPTLSIDSDDRALMDPNYKYRVQARQSEKQKSYDSESKARNLIRACDLWAQAGDSDEVQRCATQAETSIKKVVSKSTYPPQERLYTSLANVYLKSESHDAAVRCFVEAISFAARDDDAVKYYEQAKGICEEHGLTLPKPDPKAAVKLDPLNRYRVAAAKDEKDAAGSTGSSSQYRLMSAIKNWMKAGESDQALRTANQYARALMKDKTISSFDNRCSELAEIFIDLERPDAAKKCYEEALKASKYDHRKKAIQKKLDALNPADPL